LAAARAYGERGLALARRLQYPNGVAASLGNLAVITLFEGDFNASRAMSEEALAIFREVGNTIGVANALVSMADLAHRSGDHTTALTLVAEALAGHRATGDLGLVAVTLLNQGLFALAAGERATGHAALTEALCTAQAVGHRPCLVWTLECFASVHADEGRAMSAAQLLGAAEALRRDVDVSRRPGDDRRDQTSLVARAVLGEDAFATAWAEGRALSLDAAVALALEQTTAPVQAADRSQ
jgi:hypothetical protein